MQWNGKGSRLGIGVWVSPLFLSNVTLAAYLLEMCIFIYGLDIELFSFTGLSWEPNG